MRRLAFILIGVFVLLAGNVNCKQKYFERPAGTHYVFDFADLLSHTQFLELKKNLHNYTDTSGIEILLVTIPSAVGKSMYTFADELAEQWENTEEISAETVIVVLEVKSSRLGIGAGSAFKNHFPESIDQNIQRILKSSPRKAGINFENLINVMHLVMNIASGNKVEGYFTNSYSLTLFLILALLLIFFGILYPVYLIINLRKSVFSSTPVIPWSAITLKNTFLNGNINGYEEFSAGRGQFSSHSYRKILESIRGGGGGANGVW